MTAPLDPVAALAALGSSGTKPFDPVRLHYLEALARRIQGFDGEVKYLLEEKLRQALIEYQARAAQHVHTAHTAHSAHSAHSAQRIVPNPSRHSALAELTLQLGQQQPSDVQAVVAGGGGRIGGLQPELKSVRNFRATWSKLSVDRQLTQALAQAPENAGPLNSHQLVLRSLSVMRSTSPDYLNRFMSYVDALLWLDQADSHPAVATAATGEAVKKRKPSRPRGK